MARGRHPSSRVHKQIWVVLLVAFALVAAACSSEPGTSNQGAVSSDVPAAEQGVSSSNELGGGQADAASEAPPTTSTPAAPGEPALRVDQNDAVPLDESNWVARVFMDESRVDVVWSPVEGADNYRLYRLPTAEANYEAIAFGDLGDAERIYEGPEFGFVDDEDVPSSTFLTYVLVAEVGGTTTEPRWTETLTVSDVTPPTAITGLAGSVTSEGVLLEWEPSTDDVEFAAYSVSLVGDDGTLEYIGGGADESQTSFIDNVSAGGSITYRVQAFDFHDNPSEFAQITVEVP